MESSLPSPSCLTLSCRLTNTVYHSLLQKDNHAFKIVVSPGVHILFSVFVVIYKLYHVETPFPGSLDLLLWVFLAEFLVCLPNLQEGPF